MKDKINDSMQKEQESLTVYETAETVETGEHFDASQGSKQTTNRAAEKKGYVHIMNVPPPLHRRLFRCRTLYSFVNTKMHSFCDGK